MHIHISLPYIISSLDTPDVVKCFTLVLGCNRLKTGFKTTKTFKGSSTVSEQINKQQVHIPEGTELVVGFNFLIL